MCRPSLPDVGGSYLLDVFKPLKSFKKTSPRHPDFVIIVTRSAEYRDIVLYMVFHCNYQHT